MRLATCPYPIEEVKAAQASMRQKINIGDSPGPSEIIEFVNYPALKGRACKSPVLTRLSL